MLIRRGRITAAAGALLALTIAAPAEAAGSGDGGVVCPPTMDYCLVQAHDPGSAGTTEHTKTVPATAGKPVCRNQFTGQVVDCYDSTFGWFNPTDACYYKLLEPQPPGTDPVWEGHYPNGAIYDIVCPGVIGTGGGWGWSANPPPGFGPAVTAAQLCSGGDQAAPAVGPRDRHGTAPDLDGAGGSPGVVVDGGHASDVGSHFRDCIRAWPVRDGDGAGRPIVWDMGDAHSVTCANPGTSYRQSLGGGASPTCGYQYSMSSAQQPGAKYTVTATTTWNVTWAGGGQSGQLTVTRSSTTHLGVGELQVLVS